MTDDDMTLIEILEDEAGGLDSRADNERRHRDTDSRRVADFERRAARLRAAATRLREEMMTAGEVLAHAKDQKLTSRIGIREADLAVLERINGGPIKS